MARALPLHGFVRSQLGQYNPKRVREEHDMQLKDAAYSHLLDRFSDGSVLMLLVAAIVLFRSV